MFVQLITQGAWRNYMPQQHPRQVREAAVQQALTGHGSQEQIAEEHGVGFSTLQRWLREAKRAGEPVMAKKEKRPQDWTKEERLNALLEAAKLSDEELGAWCRQKGLHTHHLEKWRKELAQEQPKTENATSKQLKKEIKDLKKELSRKDKALAETSALLVLKKKADAIWGDNEED
jgi:transposase-like protein